MGKIVVSSDIPDALTAQVITEEVLMQARTEYNLRKVCRIWPSDIITGKIPLTNNLAGQEKVPELEEAKAANLGLTQVEFDMWKNVVNVVVSKEAELRANKNIMQMSVQDAGRDLARMENKQIAESLDGATGIAGTQWSNDANSPMKDIMKAVRALALLGRKPQYIAMPPTVYEAFAGNAIVVGAYVRGDTVKGRIPAVLGLEIIEDANLTDKIAWVIDQRAPAVVLFDGPEVVSQYPGGPKFYSGYAIADFLEPVLALDDGVRKLTGLLP